MNHGRSLLTAGSFLEIDHFLAGDFHRLEHLNGWKSVVPCVRDEEALIAHLRSRRPVFITEVGAETERAAA